MDSRERRQALLTALALVLAVFALYWPVRWNAFVAYDDTYYLLTNPHIAKGLDAQEVRWVFTHDHLANYHPLTWVSHMLDVELFGLEPGPHHLMNVGWHALNTVLVLFLARALLGGLPLAALTAAFFALHPLRVESVAWASERKDVLCAAFLLATLLAYLAYGRRPSLGRFGWVLFLFALALLSKPMAVTLPCIALLLDYYPLARLDPARPWLPARAPDGTRSPRVFLEKLPLFGFAAAGALSTWFAQEVGGAVSGSLAVPLELRFWNALAAYGVYLRETFLPVRLAVFHPLAATVAEDPRAELLVPALLSALVLVGVSLAAWRLRERLGWFAVGWCWFLGTLVPVIGLKQVGAQAHADRYTYLPLIGVAWIVAGLGGRLVRRRPALRWPLVGLGAVVLLALGVGTRRQIGVWRDTPTLFEHALEVTERNYVAHASLGNHAWEQGESERAREHLAQALAFYPLDATALTTLGRMELETGNLNAAEAHLQRAKQVHASKWVRYLLGRVRLARGDAQGAARQFRIAIELDPSLVDAHFNLGQVLFGLGQREEAEACFQRALALQPEHAGAHNGMGAIALASGDLNAAERDFRRAFELDPEYADAVHNLGVALERQGRSVESRACYAQARALRQ